MTTNIFEIVVGRGVLKWDAAWRVIEWLSDPTEGHGLEHRFRDRFGEFCLGSAAEPIDVAVEYYLGRDSEGTTRHPDIAVAHPDLKNPTSIALIDDLGSHSPNDGRKISNLVLYSQLCKAKFPKADRKIVVITDTTETSRFPRLHEAFDIEKSACLSILPLQLIGSWVDEIGRSDMPVVQDFVDWSTSL